MLFDVLFMLHHRQVNSRPRESHELALPLDSAMMLAKQASRAGRCPGNGMQKRRGKSRSGMDSSG